MSWQPIRAVGRLAIFGVASVLVSCGDGAGAGPDGGTFTFRVSANDYSEGEVEIWVDDQLVSPDAQTVLLAERTFSSYGQGSSGGVLIETRLDGSTLGECLVYPGACRDSGCIPTVENAGVCIFPNGDVFLNSWSCPCGSITDFSCMGDCRLTAPPAR